MFLSSLSVISAAYALILVVALALCIVSLRALRAPPPRRRAAFLAGGFATLAAQGLSLLLVTLAGNVTEPEFLAVSSLLELAGLLFLLGSLLS
jgi:hypothetical protein